MSAVVRNSIPRHPGLRAGAEARVDQSRTGFHPPPAAEVEQLVHELEVHQAELEMQNDELRRTQLELESARERLILLYDAAPVGYLTIDPSGMICEANLTATTLLRCSRADLVGRPLFRFVTRESRPATQGFLQHLRGRERTGTAEIHFQRSDRTAFTAWLECHPEPRTPGQPQRFLMTVSDITLRLEAHAQQRQLAAIVESSSDAIISRTLGDVITSWNRASERLFGYSAREMIGQSFRLLVPPDWQDELRAVRERILACERVEQYRTVRLTKDGRRILVSAASSPIQDAERRIVGISVILQDVTRQHWAEEALRQSESALADFFDQAPLGLLWVSPDGRIMRVNRAQLALFGESQESLFGRKLIEFSATPELVEAMLERLARRESLHDRLVKFRQRDGTLRHVLVDANGLWQNGKMAHSRWFVRDVTRRVQLEKEILAIGERVQGRIGQDLHDDLCQQLTGIEFLGRSLERQLAAGSPAEAVRAREISRLVRQAMTHTRELAHGMCPVELAEEGLPGALRGLAAQTRKQFRVQCVFRCDLPEWSSDHAVETHLYRIAQQAIANAIQHGKARRIDLRLQEAANKFILGIRDNGIGFTEPGDTCKGMGLRIMQYRADVIGGTLLIRRLASGGTAVVCAIPNGPPAAAARAKA